ADLYLGSDANGASFNLDGSIAAAGMIKRPPSAADLSALYAYLNDIFQVDPGPTYAASTDVAATTANTFVRITGTNFQAGTTVTIDSSGTLMPSFVASDGSYLEVATVPSLAAGKYTLTITNPDGQAITVANAINVTIASNPM